MKVELVPYDSQWEVAFEKEKSLIISAIGKYIEGIEHIGSTAIPHLRAKPIIDIMIGVISLSQADQYCIHPLVHIGYQYDSEHEAKMPERRFFKKDSPEGVRLIHLHLLEMDSIYWKKRLAFRNYLREHENIRKEYDRLKWNIAKTSINKEEYTQRKTRFIQRIETQAMKEIDLG